MLSVQQNHARLILKATRSLLEAIEHLNFDKANEALQKGALIDWGQLVHPNHATFLRTFLEANGSQSCTNIDQWLSLLWHDVDLRETPGVGAWVIEHAPQHYDLICELGHIPIGDDYIQAISQNQHAIFEKLHALKPWTDMKFVEPTYIYGDDGFRINSNQTPPHFLNLLFYAQNPETLQALIENLPTDLSEPELDNYAQKLIGYFMDHKKGDELIVVALKNNLDLPSCYYPLRLLNISAKEFSIDNAIWHHFPYLQWSDTKTYKEYLDNPKYLSDEEAKKFKLMQHLDDTRASYNQSQDLSMQTLPALSSRQKPRF